MFNNEDFKLAKKHNSLVVRLMEKSNYLEMKKSYLEKKLSIGENSYVAKLVNVVTMAKPRLGGLEKKLKDIRGKVEPYIGFIKSHKEYEHMRKFGGCVSKRGV